MPKEFRVIIAGCRSYECNDENYADAEKYLDECFSRRKPTAILCGEARGADQIGKRYAKSHGIEVKSYPADWKKYGRSAGMLRNKEMLKNADALVAFWDNISPGTKNMIVISKEKGIPVRIIPLIHDV